MTGLGMGPDVYSSYQYDTNRLEEYLLRYGVDIDQFGTGDKETLYELETEVFTGMAKLKYFENIDQVVRVIRLISIFITHHDGRSNTRKLVWDKGEDSGYGDMSYRQKVFRNEFKIDVDTGLKSDADIGFTCEKVNDIIGSRSIDHPVTPEQIDHISHHNRYDPMDTSFKYYLSSEGPDFKMFPLLLIHTFMALELNPKQYSPEGYDYVDQPGKKYTWEFTD